MPEFDTYHLTTLLSSVVILVMGICLLVVSVPKEPELRNYRISRRFLAAAYVFLSAVGLSEVFGDNGAEGQSLVMAFTVIAASYQALLFTFSLITLINFGYLTSRRVWTNVIPISLLSAILLIFLFGASEKAFDISFYIALSAYCGQLVFYVTRFSREYERYRRKLDNFFSENEERRMAWIKRSFYMATGVGALAVAALFVNTLTYTIFTAAYTVFYIYFAVKYINYVNQFHRIAPVMVVQQVEEVGNNAAMPEDLPRMITKWIATKGFLSPGITLESLARDVNTNQSYLSRFINFEYGQNFRSWINSLRVGESMRLIEERQDLTLDEIAEKIGIPSRSTFYRQFTNVAGMSPAEYRKNIHNQPEKE